MLPKNSPNESQLSVGTVCLYENDGRPMLGRVKALRKDKYQLVNQRSREVELPRFRLLPLKLKIPVETDSLEAVGGALNTIFESCSTKANEIKIDELWAVVSEQSRGYSSEELAELLFGPNDQEGHLSLRLALISDRIFFKRRDVLFEPRSLEVVEELKKSEQSRIEKTELQGEALNTFEQLIKGQVIPLPDKLRPIVRTMLEVAANCPELDNNRMKEAKELVDLCSEKLHLDLRGSREQRMTRFLELSGQLTPNTNLAFVRHRFQPEYSSDVLVAAEQIETPTDFAALSDSASRLDLTRFSSFTIDDESTKDMDDAISIEQTQDGFTLGIHISDVAHFITPGSVLERDAYHRATSVYTPELTSNMLPPLLAENKISLIEGQNRLALSCLVEVDRSYQIKDSKVVRSLIKVAKRYSYNEVDEMLYQTDSPLHNIYTIASSLETKRIEAGALRIGKREMLATILPDGDFKLIEVDENSPARNMIGELMVLANSIFANYGAKHQLPLIFRGQENPEIDPRQATDSVPEGSARDYTIRSRLKKSYTSVKPVRHSSLALEAYVQATSPIRRFADLINQRQISLYLSSGKVFHTAGELLKIIKEIEQPLGTAQAISKATRRFWLLRQLEKLQAAKQTITGTVLRTDLRNPLVEIHEVMMPTLVRLDRPVAPGDVLKFRVHKIDARNDFLRLEEIRE